MEPTLGIMALCVTMVGVLVWIVKNQQGTINNHLHHLQSSVDSLPCNRKKTCPEGLDGD